MKKFLIIFICVILVSVTITSCIVSDSPATNPKSAKLVQGTPVVSTTEFGNIIVEGIVRNDGNAKAIFVEAEATFYDKNKAIIGKYSDYIDELGVGEKWRYTIMYLGIKDELVKSVSVEIDY